MENLQGNLEKIIEPKGLSNLPKRIKRWDMLFVDDHGKVISFNHIKVIVISFLILLLILLSGSISLFFLYKDTKEKIIELQDSLALSRQDHKAVQQEMHALMVRLAEAQSNSPKKYTKKIEKAVKKVPSRTQNKSSLTKQLAKATRTSPGKNVSTKSKVTEKAVLGSSREKRISKKTPQIKPSLRKKEVGVFDFSAVHNPEQNVLRARFIIKNLNRNIPDISGYIFILLKENDPDQEKWFSIPTTKMISLKPARIKAGQFFKIRNYKTVELKSRNIQGPKTFNKATVIIFSPTEELLLKKSYRVDIDVPAPPPKIVEKELEASVPDNALSEKNESRPSDTVKSSTEPMENNTEENIKEKTPYSNPDTDAGITISDPN